MDIEFECDCGNPECKAFACFRKGYVHITHPDGTREERWDHFYIDAHDRDLETGHACWVELMMPPKGARRLMWFLVREYMPVVSRVISWWHRYVERAFLTIGWGYEDLREWLAHRSGKP